MNNVNNSIIHFLFIQLRELKNFLGKHLTEPNQRTILKSVEIKP